VVAPELLLGEVAPPAEQGSGLGDRVLEAEVLEPVQRVVMDERVDRPLAGEDMADVLHLVLEVAAQLVRDLGGGLSGREHETSPLKGTSLSSAGR
jgi:hypothetical protein